MKEKLLSLGFTEREADAYLALYQFEEATATELAKVTKEHRTNIYDSLTSLIKKGLITYTIKNNVKYYKIGDPDNLLEYIKEKERIAEDLLPELKQKITSTKEKPLIEVYEGKEGFVSILRKIIKVGETIYAVAPSEEWTKRFPIQLKQYYKEREEKKIHAKLLYVKGAKIIYEHKLNEIKYLPTEFSQPTTIVIFGIYVAMFMWSEPLVATLIKSKNLSHSFRKYFDVLWDIGKV